jgi:tetratricopeptide (TPR) repeat protein
MPLREGAPDGTLVGWRDLLEAVEDDNWLSWYHRGVARWYAGDQDGAITAWQKSRESEDNPWALRNLAILTGDESYYERAVELCSPPRAELVAEAMNACLTAGRPDGARRIFERAGRTGADPRVRLAQVRLLLRSGDPSRAEALLDEGIELPGLREGENDLAGLWREIQLRLGTDRAVPAQYEFSMLGDS